MDEEDEKQILDQLQRVSSIKRQRTELVGANYSALNKRRQTNLFKDKLRASLKLQVQKQSSKFDPRQIFQTIFK